MLATLGPADACVSELGDDLVVLALGKLQKPGIAAGLLLLSARSVKIDVNGP